jgi:hypothetical protein
MSLEATSGIVRTHPLTIVDHLYQGFSGIIEDEVDLRGIGIDCVFQQFLYGTGRTLNHFAGGDLIGYVVWQDVNGVGQRASFSVQK